jgi:transcriptional regulator GlxA family with amidase domain
MGTRVLEFFSDKFDEARWVALALESRFKVSELARKVGLSERQFERSLKHRLGIRPHDFLVRVRLRKAGELLTNGQPVKVVALILLYKQHSHFSREFKRFYGYSPRDVIRHMRKRPASQHHK